MSEVGRYLFAVVRGLDAAAIDGATGLDGQPLDVVEHRGLQAIVCDVDLAEYGEDVLPERLESLAWLEGVARTHNDVVWQVGDRATVAPMRLATICSDDASVRRRIDDHHAGLTRALDNVAGKHEWSVKAYAVKDEAPVPEPSVPAGGGGGTGAGAAYLKRKKDAAMRRQRASERSVATADEVYETLAGRAAASRRLPPQDERLTGRTEPMILNSAHLVADADTDDFVDAVRRLEGAVAVAGARVEARGPWPPYSFAVLE